MGNEAVWCVNHDLQTFKSRSMYRLFSLRRKRQEEEEDSKMMKKKKSRSPIPIHESC